MASKSFELWVMTIDIARVYALRDVYVAYMAQVKLRGNFIPIWLTENLGLINERIRLSAVRTSRGLDQVHSGEGEDV